MLTGARRRGDKSGYGLPPAAGSVGATASLDSPDSAAGSMTTSSCLATSILVFLAAGQHRQFDAVFLDDPRHEFVVGIGITAFEGVELVQGAWMPSFEICSTIGP